MADWSDREWQTLQLGPLWVVNAVLGRTHLDDLERRAFASAVVEAPIGNMALPWQLMQAVDRHADTLFDLLALDSRSIVSGLTEVTALLERVDALTSRKTRETILRVGVSVARARGPFGQSIGEQDEHQLALVGYLLATLTEATEGNSLSVEALV